MLFIEKYKLIKHYKLNICAFIILVILQTVLGAHGNWGFGYRVHQLPIRKLLVETNVPEGSNWIATGAYHTCVLLSSNNYASCAGWNNVGRLGDGTTDDSNVAVPVLGDYQFTQIDSGDSHSCGLTVSGDVICWGFNRHGQADPDSEIKKLKIPAKVTFDSTSKFSEVTCGHWHSCALLSATGVAVCWGRNDEGQNGNGTTKESSVPVPVDDGKLSFIQISAGLFHTCGVLKDNNQGVCFGAGNFGQLGNGMNVEKETLPVYVKGDYAFSMIESGFNFSCGLILQTGHCMCWGSNDAGQLGNNSDVASNIPVKVQGSLSFKTISAGYHHCCGILKVNFQLYCWGKNTSSQLLLGSSSNTSSKIPIAADTDLRFSQVSAGDTHTCGLVLDSDDNNDRKFVCWGNNLFGMLSDGSNTDSDVPVYVKSGVAGSQEGSSSSNTGIIVGAVVGGIVVVVLLGVGVFYALKHNKSKKKEDVLANPTTLPSHLPPSHTATAITTTTTTATSSSLMRHSSASHNDPLLTWASSAALTSHKSSRPSSGSGSGAMSCTEIDYMDLQLGEKLGTGSFGAVYKATYNFTTVAVKFLIDKNSKDQYGYDQLDGTNAPLLEELEKEAGLMASPALRHPNIIQIMGVCFQPPAIIVEYCDRGSLTSTLHSIKVSQSTLSWKTRVSLALDTAKGMLHLHTRSPPILHRDLKSPNLLITESWHVKVADFNLSKLTSEGGAASLTTTKGGAENPRWLAPEILEGGKATAAADVFAFGVVMWELLTLTVPWHDVHNALIIAMQIMSGKRLAVPREQEVVLCGGKTLPGYGKYVALLEQCWTQNKDDRPNFKYINGILTEILSKLD